MAKQLIYVVEDDASIRQLYEYAFDGNFTVKGFDTAEDMFLALNESIPSLIILDLMLPKMDGITALSLIKENADFRDIPVIIVSANGEETIKVKGLNTGADDYMEKPFGVLELTARIKKILGRQKNTAESDILSYKAIEINLKKHSVKLCGERVELTPKEFDILHLLISSQGEVVKRDRIFDIVWGENFFTETRTLDIHINSLRKKIKDISGDEYIQTVRGVGYIIE